MYKNCAKYQIPDFNGQHSNISIYITLEKSWILKLLGKEHIFLYWKKLKLQSFIRPIGAFTSLDVAIFRVTLCGRAQIFVKKAPIYKNDMSQIVFIFSMGIKCEKWKE